MTLCSLLPAPVAVFVWPSLEYVVVFASICILIVIVGHVVDCYSYFSRRRQTRSFVLLIIVLVWHDVDWLVAGWDLGPRFGSRLEQNRETRIWRPVEPTVTHSFIDMMCVLEQPKIKMKRVDKRVGIR
jgi:hypothetical protein